MARTMSRTAAAAAPIQALAAPPVHSATKRRVWPTATYTWPWTKLWERAPHRGQPFRQGSWSALPAAELVLPLDHDAGHGWATPWLD
jgi:hypothetical protein